MTSGRQLLARLAAACLRSCRSLFGGSNPARFPKSPWMHACSGARAPPHTKCHLLHVQSRPADKAALQSGCMPRSRFAGQQLFQVAVTSVSLLMRRHSLQRIDLLKIDVEGSELDVLLGIEAADFLKIRNVVAEIHGVHDHHTSAACDASDHGKVAALLMDQGFAIRTEPGVPACNAILFATRE